MKQILTVLTLFILTGIVNGQEKVLYHSYSPTASSWNIIEWNIADRTKHQWVLKETVDAGGKVIELEFLKNGKLIEDHLCYLANRVKFEYDVDKITETLYHIDQELLATDCEMHYQNIYCFDKEGFITKLKSFVKYDFDGIDETAKEQWKERVPETSIKSDSIGVNLQVEYYYHSFSKMNDIYPVNRHYEIVDDYYYGDQPEKESILNGIKKIATIINFPADCKAEHEKDIR